MRKHHEKKVEILLYPCENHYLCTRFQKNNKNSVRLRYDKARHCKPYLKGDRC